MKNIDKTDKVTDAITVSEAMVCGLIGGVIIAGFFGGSAFSNGQIFIALILTPVIGLIIYNTYDEPKM